MCQVSVKLLLDGVNGLLFAKGDCHRILRARSKLYLMIKSLDGQRVRLAVN